MVTIIENCALGLCVPAGMRKQAASIELSSVALQPKTIGGVRHDEALPTELSAVSLSRTAHGLTASAKVVRQYSR